MKLLIIGATGQLGSALINDATFSGHELVTPSRKELDITDIVQFKRIMNEHCPDVVLNTAAYHNLPLCEDDPLKAFLVNCIAVDNMAKISNEKGSWFVSFSTDYVFSGDKKEPYFEFDHPLPLQKYGLSKLAGEYAALSYERSMIIRTCGLYGLYGASSKGGNFVDNRVKDSERHPMMEIGNDQTVSPTYAGDLSKAVLRLVSHPSKEPGIYHLVNEGYCTWYEFTQEIFRLLDIGTELVPVNRRGRTGEMRRPLFSALKNERAGKMGIVLPHWKEGLRKYLEMKYDNLIRG